MSWTGHDLPNGWKLFTRGGTNGVYIQEIGSTEKIAIPSQLLRMLVADDIRSKRISDLEDAESDEILGLSGDEG